MKITSGQRQVLGHGTISIENPQDRSIRAVIPRQFSAASIELVGVGTNTAGRTSNIDIATDSLSNPLVFQFIVSSFYSIHVFDDPHKFMTQDPMKAHVSLQNFQICIANTRSQDSNEGKAWLGHWFRDMYNLSLCVARVDDRKRLHHGSAWHDDDDDDDDDDTMTMMEVDQSRLGEWRWSVMVDKGLW
jgi:hypothetical protein